MVEDVHAAIPYALKADREALRAHYLDEGYLFAGVRQETRNVEGGVDVLYHIEAGPKVKLETIKFEGNTDIPDGDILPVMMSLKGSSLLSAGKYDPALLRSELLAVRELVRCKGYLDATVGHEILFDAPKERAYMVVRILEGPLYRISSLTIRGARVIPPAELAAAIKLHAGEPFAQEQLDKDIETIRNLYGRIGYIKAEVRVERVFSAAGPLASVALNVDEGEKYYVNKVVIRGNLKTQDHVIRRAVTLLPGDVANSAAIEETQKRLENLGYFTTSEPGEKSEAVHVRFVDVIPPETSDVAEPNATDVLVEVTEGNMGSITFGAGISSELGLIGNIRLTHRNFDATAFPQSWAELFRGEAFTGDGQQLVLSLTPGIIYNDYRFSWLNPSVWDSPYSIGFDAYLHDIFSNNNESEFYYDERRVGASITIGRRFFKDLNVTLTPREEFVRLYDFSTNSPADALAEHGWHERRAVTLAADYDKRDNPFFTTSGYRLGGAVEMAGTIFGGDVNTLRETVEARQWWTVWDAPDWGKHTLTVGAQAGIVESTDAGAVPIFDRFWMGGLGSLRGFEWRGVGPVDPRTGEWKAGNTCISSTPNMKSRSSRPTSAASSSWTPALWPDPSATSTSSAPRPASASAFAFRSPDLRDSRSASTSASPSSSNPPTKSKSSASP